MKHWDYYEYRIAGQYLSLMINDDMSGMETDEIRLYGDFDQQARQGATEAGFTVGHWATVGADGDDWGVCDVSGLFAMRCTVRLMVYKTNVVKL